VYYWAKYFKKNVSIISQYYKVENWGADGNGTVRLEEVLENPFGDYPRPRINVTEQCQQFMCDFVHFSDKELPWMSTKKPTIGSPAHLWYDVLSQLSEKLHMGIDFSDWFMDGVPPALAGYQSPGYRSKTISKRTKRGTKRGKKYKADARSA
jgi:hypothetical protein